MRAPRDVLAGYSAAMDHGRKPHGGNYFEADLMIKELGEAGFVIVPIEPTPAMEKAGEDHEYNGCTGTVLATWDAMLRAAQ